MRNLITKPEGAWAAYWQGVGTVALGAGVPLVGTCLIRFWGHGFWRVLAVSLALSTAGSLIAGIGCALWRLVQLWAYERFTSGPYE